VTLHSRFLTHCLFSIKFSTSCWRFASTATSRAHFSPSEPLLFVRFSTPRFTCLLVDTVCGLVSTTLSDDVNAQLCAGDAIVWAGGWREWLWGVHRGRALRHGARHAGVVGCARRAWFSYQWRLGRQRPLQCRAVFWCDSARFSSTTPALSWGQEDVRGIYAPACWMRLGVGCEF
jgi:hypothetical protein